MDRLFETWKESEKHKGFLFNEDGIVNQEIWNQQNKKILFFFKEAYHKDEYENYNLAKDLNENEPWRMWLRVAEWVYAIQNTTITKIAKYGENLASHDLIKSIAVVNVKKSNGKSTSNDDDLMSYASADKDLLRKQIEMIKPNIIVCGNTGKYLDFIYDGAMYKNGTDYNDNWYYKLDEMLVLSYCHPAGRSIYALMQFYGLAAIYHHALIEGY